MLLLAPDISEVGGGFEYMDYRNMTNLQRATIAPDLLAFPSLFSMMFLGLEWLWEL